MSEEASLARPAVWLRLAAGGPAARLAGRVAAGAAEAFGLASGPTRRLITIAVEATRNAVEHAYGDRGEGAIEVEITRRPAPEGRSSGRGGEVLLSVRDLGAGCPLGPTASEPPGLGLSIISELSDALTIRSFKGGGTEIDALVHFGPPDGEPERPRSEPVSVPTSELRFGDPSALALVLPRAIAVHAAARSASMSALDVALARGRILAVSLLAVGHLPSIAIDTAGDPDRLHVRVGPLEGAVADAVLERLERAGERGEGPWWDLRPGTHGGSDIALKIPLR